jgi:hypothetical protein
MLESTLMSNSSDGFSDDDLFTLDAMIPSINGASSPREQPDPRDMPTLPSDAGSRVASRPLRNSGGLTWTHALDSTSSAIDQATRLARAAAPATSTNAAALR